MIYLKLTGLVIVLLAISFSGMAIRMIFKKNAEFSGGSFKGTKGLNDKGVGCGCDGSSCKS